MLTLLAPLLTIAAPGDGNKFDVPYIKGTFKHAMESPYQPKDVQPPKQQWYINDHCFFVDKTGTLHWFGITNPYPETGTNYYGKGSHRIVGHASTNDPFGKWDSLPYALESGVQYDGDVGATFVVNDPKGNEYVMIWGYNQGFHRATSNDLVTWKFDSTFDTLWIGKSTRDPCLIRLKDGNYLLYACCGVGDYGAVGLARSKDMKNFEVLEPAMVSTLYGGYGSLESPFVYEHKGVYYLFVNASHRQYQETLVFASKDPYKFDWSKPLTTIFAHAAEIFDYKGKTYISHCGIEDRHWRDSKSPYGLYLAELGWFKP